MRILWFTNTPSCYKVGTNIYNGGGWISSVEAEMKKRKDVLLAVSFLLNNQPWRIESCSVTYYPMTTYGRLKISKLWDVIRPMSGFCGHLGNGSFYRESEHVLAQMKRVITDYKPDIIQIFGSEGPFGLIATEVTVPVVLHLQGLLNPCLNAYFVPGMSFGKYLLSDLNPLYILQRLYDWRIGQYRAAREKEIIRRISHYIGRTEWDMRCIEVMHPGAKYHYGGEVLRENFYESVERRIPDRLVIITTISSPMYKGLDIALKTARILKKCLNMDFEWRMYGNINPQVVESAIGIKHSDVNISFCGVVSARQLGDALTHATVYVHTSYIENSPNSVCEAQMIGLPVVVTHVGGTYSLIKEGITGFSVPANDPYQMAYIIRYLYIHKDENVRIGMNAREDAVGRHDKDTIVGGLLDIYKSIMEKRSNSYGGKCDG